MRLNFTDANFNLNSQKMNKNEFYAKYKER